MNVMNFARYYLGLYFVSVTLTLSLSVNAQQLEPPSSRSSIVPRLVNFSGRAADPQGRPIQGITGVTFAIYRDEEGGAPLWTETQNVQADAKGNYSVQLGATTPEGLALDLFTSGDARWLGVRVNGGDERSRVLLLSVPYALKAADAETIGGLPPSAFIRSDVAEGARADQMPTRSKPGATKAQDSQANADVTGKGVVNFIPMWDTTSDIVDSLIFQKSSSIGINTKTPAATLDVNGKADVRDTLTLFPKGTDSTLAVNGTAFKVDSTGKITFVSGQTFPGKSGSGTVTSVGLSAPSSDFKVTGSPITKSGTLGLNWNVAPTTADTANAIVKRDANGSFAAGAITANLGMEGITAVDSGNGVAGINTGAGTAVYGGGNQGVGVWGQSFGNGPVSDGVHGVTGSGGGSGVAGVNNGGGIGVYGTGGTGVFGTGSAFGMVTDSNVQQARTAGGWVKAMVFASGDSGNIISCFNSTFSGAAASSPPCGFTLDKTGVGDYILDFGFEVDDRFFSATPTTNGLEEINALELCTKSLGVVCNSNITVNEVEVWSLYPDDYGGFRDTKFFLIVY
jgi:hypothetical protein